MSELLHCHAESFIFSMTDISLDKLSVHRRYGDIKGLSWFSESGEDFTISGHSSSLSWLTSLAARFVECSCLTVTEHSAQEWNLNSTVGPSQNTLTSIPEWLARKQEIRTVAVCDLESDI